MVPLVGWFPWFPCGSIAEVVGRMGSQLQNMRSITYLGVARALRSAVLASMYEKSKTRQESIRHLARHQRLRAYSATRAGEGCFSRLDGQATRARDDKARPR